MQNILAHLLHGLMAPEVALEDEGIPSGFSRSLVEIVPEGDWTLFRLGEKRGYGIVTGIHLYVFLRVDCNWPMFVVISFEEEELCVNINDEEFNPDKEFTRELIEAHKRLIKLRDKFLKEA